MTLVDDIGNALRTAINAGAAHFGTAIGKTGANLHVEYGMQSINWPKGATGRCQIWYESEVNERANQLPTSARSTFRFRLAFELRDTLGKKHAESIVQQGLKNVLNDAGEAVFNTHLVDTGTNRLGKGGEIAWELDAERNADVDPDQPIVFVAVDATLTHKTPLE